MSDVTHAKHGRSVHHWRRDLVELAALFTAVAVADVMANLIGHGPDGPVLLVVSAALLLITVGFHTWWTRRHSHAPPTADPGARPALPTAPHAAPEPLPTTSAETPGTEPGATHAAAVTLRPVRPVRPQTAPAGSPPGIAPSAPAVSPATEPSAATLAPGATPTTLWRLRTTVRDAPGSLAALCTAMAERHVDILSLQTHPLTEGTVDEFLLRVPAELSAADLSSAVSGVGGGDTWIERADTHDLADTPTRVLGLAIRTALDPAELPLALRRLLGRCTIRSLPAPTAHRTPIDTASGTRDSYGSGPAAAALPDTVPFARGGRSSAASRRARPLGEQAGPAAEEARIAGALRPPAQEVIPPVEGVLDGTVLHLRAPEGGLITVERPYLPFTPTEFARARALVELDARLGPRVPGGQDVLTLPRGQAVTVRRADAADLEAAKAMHKRCSGHTLGMRYHGSTGDADRYLDHLLSPRFGRTLAAQTASGRIVALGHLLWDGDETEVALLVEDEWQRHGIGRELLGRLVAMAMGAGSGNVYAVTKASNTGMVAAMRGLGLPLDYQIEESTLVITARLESPEPATPMHPRPSDGVLREQARQFAQD
jgi:GNAT superfamily N-acetyltransferase